MTVVAAAVAASAANVELRRIQVGMLTCSLSASIGLVVGSQRNVSCMFRGTSGEPDEPYTRTMTRVGLDVGLTTGSVIIGAVFADTNRYKGMLTGTYAGASADMSIAAGLGANGAAATVGTGIDRTRHCGRHRALGPTPLVVS